MYEVYTDSDAFQQHLQSVHFKRFDDAVANMVIDKTVISYDEVRR